MSRITSKGRSRTATLFLRDLPLLALACMSTGCEFALDETVYGSGVAAVQSPQVQAFDRLCVSGTLEVEVEVGVGPALQLKGDSNLLSYVQVEQLGSKLRVSVREGYALDPAPKVELLAPALSGVELFGPGRLRAFGLAGEVVKVDAVGSGELQLEGSAPRLIGSLTGSGVLALRELEAKDVELVVTGSGRAHTHPVDRLQATVVGSGSIRYVAGAELESSVTGSGSVDPLPKDSDG